ncbi:MAG: MBL fold metallo-hydrolase [Desulfovibrio sp.]|nr:MAG: MBL fold metallo-hydrolase [Desulfovibrio sp.]
MEATAYTAQSLYTWILDESSNFLLLDVRNPTEFTRFKVEGPKPIDMLNVPYMEFVEFEEASVAKVPKGKPVRIVCAKEGSAKFVADILLNNGFTDVGFLAGGIKSWGNMLVPKLLADNGYQLYQFIRPGKASCSYGLASGGELMLFDPSRNVDFYQQFAEEKGLAITATFETHLQADYIAGSNSIAQATSATFLAPPDDFKDAQYEYTPAQDGDIYGFTQPGPEIRVLHTPGHTPGSTCYLIDGTYLVSGDTMFIQSVGRPDLGGKAEAWSKMLFTTLTQIIGPMGNSTLILPGHFADWSEANEDFAVVDTLGAIRNRNAAIYAINNEADFYAFIRDNMREQPPEYAKIRLINAGLSVVDDEEAEVMDLGKNECAASAGK